MKKAIAYALFLVSFAPSVSVGQNVLLGEFRPVRAESLALSRSQDGDRGNVTGYKFKVLDVVDGNNCILKVRHSPHYLREDVTVWVEMATDLLVDDRIVEIYCEVAVGKTKYQMVDGASRTILKLTPINPTLKPYIEEPESPAEMAARVAAEKKAAKEKFDAAREKFFRELKIDKSIVKARFVEFKNGSAKLALFDTGAVITVKLSDLSDEDQKWLRAQIKLAADRKRVEDQEKKDQYLREMGFYPGTVDWVRAGGSRGK